MVCDSLASYLYVACVCVCVCVAQRSEADDRSEGWRCIACLALECLMVDMMRSWAVNSLLLRIRDACACRIRVGTRCVAFSLFQCQVLDTCAMTVAHMEVTQGQLYRAASVAVAATGYTTLYTHLSSTTLKVVCTDGDGLSAFGVVWNV